jgi:hypothetical protein
MILGEVELDPVFIMSENSTINCSKLLNSNIS